MACRYYQKDTGEGYCKIPKDGQCLSWLRDDDNKFEYNTHSGSLFCCQQARSFKPDLVYHKVCESCKKPFDTTKRLQKHHTECYNSFACQKHRKKYMETYELPVREHNTKCPQCGHTHYKKGYTMRDRVRCTACIKGKSGEEGGFESRWLE